MKSSEFMVRAAFVHAFRASQLAKVFLHSLTLWATSSGSRMMNVTAAAMLNALTCMVFLLSSQKINAASLTIGTANVCRILEALSCPYRARM
jgi:hypothetical protein